MYKQKDGISSRKIGNDLMLYDKASDKVHVLNETGAIVWSFLDGKSDLKTIQDHFIKQFPETNTQEISKDIQEIIEKLLSEGLILPLS